jgi:hypothetical protein
MCFGAVSELREKFYICEMTGHCCVLEGLVEDMVRNREEDSDSANPQACKIGISEEHGAVQITHR